MSNRGLWILSAALSLAAFSIVVFKFEWRPIAIGLLILAAVVSATATLRQLTGYDAPGS